MIDHEGFPAIVSSIVDYSPESALHAWRGTSRYYKLKADAALLKHITLDVPRCSAGRRLSASRGRPLHVRSSSGRRIPGLAWENPDASPAERQTWSAMLKANVKVVDYAAEIAFPDDDAKLASALSDVGLLRRLFNALDIIPWRLDCWRYALPAMRVVDYVCLGTRPVSEKAHVHGSEEMEEEEENDDEDDYRHVILDMPPSVKSSVTVIRYDPAHAVEMPYRWQFWDRSGHASFVCVFVNTPSGLLASEAHVPPQRPWSFVRPLIRALRSYAPSTRPVLVGITEIPRPAIGLEEDTSDDDVRASFLEILIAEVLSWDDVLPGRLRRITESITFLTHAEYRQRVGAEAYELEVGGKVFTQREEPDAREVLRQLRI
ncbi:hypothetical protein CcaverHIS002_0100120 [Cutaneotrichosporon cavernicola]|uniref:Uncharacterized protein n=1 Tax=Cutaneotrichosporon cavernicola TaxID=279322 RepID=A0AA48L0A3_9TREE|nr:uncharacterized protein CcaverHIS019_0100100 [Cutaneotrichosporon cavernicola]BEI79483.1 hypothetical protein CcaverHIS002_0100120 [Cutaneotrichosporon cavernicola]BEI87292.1 hypothetical protein CcaverHIS019_0100100 [Cutaneotrichosporon cavernicola]BEI95062.1 hypothetical protein CcaverHIS631_0100110 [Cutaneotrichosporon cavernicola]BEJ02836.1 hypothetical protein CcaverHIS641_0100110 [Cutaneotrichosporon cavernicola]